MGNWGVKDSAVRAEIDLRALGAELEATLREVNVGAAASINKALMKARTQATREIATEAKVSPQRLVRKRMRIDKASSKRFAGSLRVLTRGVRLDQMSGVVDTGADRKTGRRKFSDEKVGIRGLRRQIGSGVKGAGHSFPHAFIAEGMGGYRLVFQRKGKKRTPLEVIRIDLHEIAKEVINRLAPTAAEWAKTLLESEIRWRVARRTR
jgi:hypothetical protein